MADESGQKAMLYFIEVLMNSSTPLSISQLAGRFGTKSFTPEMRLAAGGNEEGLRAFLSKYPSLFHIEGLLVSVNNHGAPIPYLSDEEQESSKSQLSDVQLELGAVKYFQDKLQKKGGSLPIKSLAGHLSQAPSDMRPVVGPQSEFRAFLIKHKDIFHISEEDNVSLTEDVVAGQHSKSSSIPRSESESSLELPARTKEVSKKPSPITMTASEYKTMKYVKELVETGEGAVTLANVMKKVPDASEAVKNILGDNDHTKLITFVNKFPNIFILTEDMITLKKTRLNVIMAGSRPSSTASPPESAASPPSRREDTLSSSLNSSLSESIERPSINNNTPPKPTGVGLKTLNNHKGPVYHLAKLWGIVDLGKHEHVFFDRSILPDGYDDLAKRFKIGDMLRFNAVRAARGSRARWRATHVWKDGEDIRSMYGADSTFSITGFNSESLDDELERLLPGGDSAANIPNDQYAYVDASKSSTGCIPVWTVNTHSEQGVDKGIPSLSMVPESKFMQKSAMKDTKQLIPGYMLVPTLNKQKPQPLHNGNGVMPATREIACQTISTGDIMATQLYQDDE